MTAGVSRACFADPDSNTSYLAFAKHWGFMPLPTRPYSPQENGKQERSGGYCKHNAYRKDQRFESLRNTTITCGTGTSAGLEPGCTARPRQVWTHFLESDLPALRPAPRRTSHSSSAARARCPSMRT